VKTQPLLELPHPRKLGKNVMTANDLKDSSSIYQDLDLLIILHRDQLEFNDVEKEKEGFDSQPVFDNLTEVYLQGRFIEGGYTRLMFDGDRFLFHEKGGKYQKAIREHNARKKQAKKRSEAMRNG